MPRTWLQHLQAAVCQVCCQQLSQLSSQPRQHLTTTSSSSSSSSGGGASRFILQQDNLESEGIP
jgi:hypothetical protein